MAGELRQPKMVSEIFQKIHEMLQLFDKLFRFMICLMTTLQISTYFENVKYLSREIGQQFVKLRLLHVLWTRGGVPSKSANLAKV